MSNLRLNMCCVNVPKSISCQVEDNMVHLLTHRLKLFVTMRLMFGGYFSLAKCTHMFLGTIECISL